MKYTKVENVRLLISLLKSHNIRHVVTSPGGTNIPIVQGVQQDPFFTCHSVVDERSAMYFAIGLYLQTGELIATTCTSAQATRNYLPGLTEAFYKNVPILAITCSKHPRYTYQGIMQAPDQVSLPQDSVKKSYNLPYIACNHDRAMCIRMINEAILELTHHSLGPVQLNIPIVDSERLSFEECELPEVRVIRRFNAPSEKDISLKGKRILVVAGESRPYSDGEEQIIEDFLKTHDAILYRNHLSNIHVPTSINANLLVTGMSQSLFDKDFAPDILITIGGQVGDYSIHGKLASSKVEYEHWRVSPDGNVVDTYDRLTKVFECSTHDFFSALGKMDKTDENAYKSLWTDYDSKINCENIELPFSNIYAAQQLHDVIPEGSIINFAILNSLRSWMMFPLHESISCFSPVGAFGIDGGMSMALGQSVSTDSLCFFVTGDLAFLYDMNSLSIKELKNNIRILLINNNKGVEFSIHGTPRDIDFDTNISAHGHNCNAEGWAKTVGFKYLSANNYEDFNNAKDIFLSNEQDKSVILELFTSPEDEAEALREMITVNSTGEAKDQIKKIVRKIVGDKIINILRK